MEYIIGSENQKRNFFAYTEKYVSNFSPLSVKYICLNNITVRVLCRTEDILPLLKQQFTYTLKNTAEKYDATIAVWHEKEPRYFLAHFDEQFDPRKNIRLRLDNVLFKNFYIRIRENINSGSVFAEIDENAGKIGIYDFANKTFYIGLKSFANEDIIKWGHLFVQQLYRICSSAATHLVHGAVVGIKGNGVLFCARGGGGKSTLTVNALLNGFDYVSDDFLILQKENNSLYASPIYSIITLSPKMYATMYDKFDGKFISNNSRLDKYVFNIAHYHRQFYDKYPIKMCMSLNICNIKEPEISACNIGPAATRLIHSTIKQNADTYNTSAVKKLSDFVKYLPCYQFNLCPDIEKNTQYLRNFLTSEKGR